MWKCVGGILIRCLKAPLKPPFKMRNWFYDELLQDVSGLHRDEPRHSNKETLITLLLDHNLNIPKRKMKSNICEREEMYLINIYSG